MAPRELGSHSDFAYRRVDDADAFHAAATASGLAASIGPVADQPWGMREFPLTTPDGHRLMIGQSIDSSSS